MRLNCINSLIDLMSNRDKIYFASDFHLGVPSYEKSRERERVICSWLDSIKSDAKAVFLVGDLFDFWFEYKYTIPKGYIRFLGKLAELKDSGIDIYIYIGNHDMWMFDYLEQELDINILREAKEFIFSEKSFLIGHGDGLGPGDYGYKFIKKVFANKFCQWLFARLHPNFSFGIAQFWSKKSRDSQISESETYLGDDEEWLFQYCKEYLETKNSKINYFVFGHRHLPIDVEVKNSKYINLGEWIHHKTYAVFDGSDVALKTFKP